MRKVIVLGIALVVAVSAITVSTSPGLAQVRIVQKGCDTLSFTPPRVHVPFAVINLTPIPVCSIHMIPIPSGPFPPCQIFDCSVPNSAWSCFTDSLGGAHWYAQPDTAGVTGGCIQPYQKLEPFDLVIDPPYCCYKVLYDDGNGQIFFQDIVCFQCESPTATQVKTWGSLKHLYR